MKRWYLLVGLLVFVAACTTTTTGSGSDTPFIGGTNGLIIEFLENAPPREVADKGQFPFDIIVKLTNEGEQFVARNDVEVTISGLFPDDFGKTIAQMRRINPDDDLLPVRKDTEGAEIPGTQSQVRIPGLNYLDTLDGNVKFPVRAEVCYAYTTRANALYCMRENLLDRDEGVCDVRGSKTIHNSGGPIQVTSFSQNVAGTDTLSFTFTVAQKGNGNVFRPGTGTMCDSSSFINENRVKVRVDTDLAGLRCLGLFDRSGLAANEGFVLLTSGDATFTCTQDIADFDAEKELSVILEYEYEETKTTDIIVKHFPE